jgi:small subunit ribosomal protein S17
MTIIGGKNIKELVGTVTSTKMAKTLAVEVDTVKMHPLYKKRYVRSKKYYAHIDDNSNISVGDIVKIRQYRPTSKLKRWIYVDTVKKVKA